VEVEVTVPVSVLLLVPTVPVTELVPLPEDDAPELSVPVTVDCANAGEAIARTVRDARMIDVFFMSG
jgi:hypothetical protein